MPAPPMPKRKPTTIDALHVAPEQWQGLAEAALSTFHEQIHLHAGRQRVARARLCVGTGWAQASGGRAHVRGLMDRLAINGAPVEVLVVPGLQRPELRLSWAPWLAGPQAPMAARQHRPVAARPHPDLQPAAAGRAAVTAAGRAAVTAAGQAAFAAAAVRDAPASATSPQPVPQPTPGARTMSFKNLFGLTELFNPNAPADAPAAHDEAPTLEPIGTRAPPSPGSQWMASLPLIAEKIGDEVRDLREMQGSVNFGFQIWTLTFHVSPANEAALRNPMSLSQRDDGVLKTLVESGFAKSSAAPWLNTQRMKIEFKRSEARLDDAAEVLMSSGSTGVPLQFGYSGQIEVLPAGAQRPGVNALSAHPAIAAAMVAPAAAAGAATGAAINTLAATPASTLTTPPTTHPGPTDVLLLWAQLPGQKQVQRWAFTAGPVNVGADYEATLCVDQHHVSGEHLQLTCDEHGRWQVVDRSRNGSHLLDASAEGATETPLPTHVLRPLPPAGVLRLGPLPDDPLLHIHITPAAPPAPAQAAPGSRGRVTRLATDPAAAPAQFAAAQRRSTSLS